MGQVEPEGQAEALVGGEPEGGGAGEDLHEGHGKIARKEDED
jgi:hypothetical protein